MFLVDTHAHLNDPAFTADLPLVLARATKAGVRKIVVVGHNMATSRQAVALALQSDDCYATVGVHPHDAPETAEDSLAELAGLLGQTRVVALGEIGLDYHWNTWPKEVSQRAFRAQIALAKALCKPFVVHNRDAHADVLALLKEQAPYHHGFVMHCFSGSLEVARECMRLGGDISLAGPVTFRNAHNLHDVAKNIPLERLLIETDCPYLAPDPYRGQRNEPAFLVKIAEAIAFRRGLDVTKVAEATSANAQRLFSLGDVS
ncbi:MAG: putative metal-dependent hydrolase YcfH [Firmicutes bacterium]|nr:putative metal-dependent hydrolase YcfH [candidate division NPL-UPA2 bacterium]